MYFPYNASYLCIIKYGRGCSRPNFSRGFDFRTLNRLNVDQIQRIFDPPIFLISTKFRCPDDTKFGCLNYYCCSNNYRCITRTLSAQLSDWSALPYVQAGAKARHRPTSDRHEGCAAAEGAARRGLQAHPCRRFSRRQQLAWTWVLPLARSECDCASE